MLMLNDVVTKHYGGMACDFTGGIVQVPDHSFLLFSAVIPSPGGGVLPVLHVLTNSKSASALESSLLRWQQFVQNQFDINHFAPHSIMTDDDAAETKALNAVFNHRTIGSVLDSLKAELRDLREEVVARGWGHLQADELPADAVLPLLGHNAAQGDTPARLLLTHGITFPFLCQGHTLKAAMDHPLFGTHFKRLPTATRRFMSWLMVLLVRFAITSPCFAGPLNYHRLEGYSRNVRELLTTPDAVVGQPFAGGLAVVRDATEADRKPGRRAPTHVLVITGLDNVCIASVRIYDGGGGGEEALGEALDVPSGVVASAAEALGLPGDSQLDAVVARTERADYLATLPEEEEALESGAAAGPAAATEDAAAVSADAQVTAGAAASALRVPLPIFFSVKPRGGLTSAEPLALSWDIRASNFLRSGPTFRTEFPSMCLRGNCSSIVEESFGFLKHKLLLSKLPFKSITLAAQALAKLMQETDAAEYLEWARKGDPVSQTHFARIQAGAARRARVATPSSPAAAAAAAAADESDGESGEEGGSDEPDEEDGGARADPCTVWGAGKTPARKPTRQPSRAAPGGGRDAPPPAALESAQAEATRRKGQEEKQAAAAAKASEKAERSAAALEKKRAATVAAEEKVVRTRAAAEQAVAVHQRQSFAAVALRPGGLCASCSARPCNQACSLGACCGACCAAAKRRMQRISPELARCAPNVHRS
jgi:hypothetical protein